MIFLLLSFTAFLIGIVVYSWTKILHPSRRDQGRTIAFTISVIFAAVMAWALYGFIQNENGKSFTVGWFALAYFMIQILSVYALLCYITARFFK